jgi:hypothetical protein
VWNKNGLVRENGVTFCCEDLFSSTEKKKLYLKLQMGCLKLTYREELPSLKVVSNILKTSENSCAGAYRYGFQGQETDGEIKGENNSVNFNTECMTQDWVGF